jgi:hypothetical protein
VATPSVTAEIRIAAISAARTDGLASDAVGDVMISAMKMCCAALGLRSDLTGH